MPLSKARDKESRWRERARRRREREERRRERASVQPSFFSVQPNFFWVQSKPDWLVQPNQYLLGHLSVCPDYNPLEPREHWETCPYVNPALRSASAVPK